MAVLIQGSHPLQPQDMAAQERILQRDTLRRPLVAQIQGLHPLRPQDMAAQGRIPQRDTLRQPPEAQIQGLHLLRLRDMVPMPGQGPPEDMGLNPGELPVRVG